METKLFFKYDREGDILYINKRPPYPEQNSEELGDEVIARLNPKTGEIENLPPSLRWINSFHLNPSSKSSCC